MMPSNAVPFVAARDFVLCHSEDDENLRRHGVALMLLKTCSNLSSPIFLPIHSKETHS
jgi:hypothetical protein